MTTKPDPFNYTPKANDKPEKHETNKYPCAACGYVGPVDVDLNDLDALRSLTKRRLVEAIQNLPLSAKSLVAACNALLDRIDGKPAQTVQQNVNHSGSVIMVDKEEVQRIIDNWLNPKQLESSIIENSTT